MNICVHILYGHILSIFLIIYLQVQLLGNVFEGVPNCIFKPNHYFTFSLNILLCQLTDGIQSAIYKKRFLTSSYTGNSLLHLKLNIPNLAIK